MAVKGAHKTQMKISTIMTIERVLKGVPVSINEVDH